VVGGSHRLHGKAIKKSSLLDFRFELSPLGVFSSSKRQIKIILIILPVLTRKDLDSSIQRNLHWIPRRYFIRAVVVMFATGENKSKGADIGELVFLVMHFRELGIVS
jgi:hypothetical protein